MGGGGGGGGGGGRIGKDDGGTLSLGDCVGGASEPRARAFILPSSP